ncbi:uncharacterized protein LOC119633611 [Glossina fuscipes]|uniref:Uncharacterized protein LOC119633611 n=1 Tax=Glossina fuscipes TaxID=7396 RepID=A0A8U0WDD4_9MUSC|nr:uncharacterized protein LOC119633611 [Glossina fuscipes]
MPKTSLIVLPKPAIAINPISLHCARSDRDNSFVSISNNVNNSIGSRSLNGLIRNEQSWEEVTIVVPWGTIQGKWWGSRNKQPILALDGWQDNFGTFDRLCPLMPAELPVLCIDLPAQWMATPTIFTV